MAATASHQGAEQGGVPVVALAVPEPGEAQPLEAVKAQAVDGVVQLDDAPVHILFDQPLLDVRQRVEPSPGTA